ncbi:MAG: cyclodeaminase/cyclohydrolase family protein [Lachnospiraceae bacterium]|nr:cyclodeaminase/cyclohydrolase family protein [Lachnospiraceae bacterium]
MKSYRAVDIETYVAELASGQPVPGGGGTSALVGALSVALCSMVARLTQGKEKYAAVEEDIQKIIKEADKLQNEFLDLVDKDPVAFEPLSKAYSMPKNTPEEIAEKERVMEDLLHEAASVPIGVMDCCAQALDLIEEVLAKGSTMVLSDTGAAASICKAALESAALNVVANTSLMKDKDYAHALNTDAARFLAEYQEKADKIFDKTYGILLRKGLGR